MSTVVWAAALLVLLPIAFNVAFAALAATFDYPDVLRRPTHEVLELFRSRGRRLIVTWWAFALTAVALVPLAVLVSAAMPGSDATLRALAATLGVLAGVVQFLGLVRWPFLVPYLARISAEDGSPLRREVVDVVFQSFNRYLGVAVGEHLGYLLTGSWTALVGVLVVQSDAAPWWLGVVGVIVGALLAVCSLEFVGRDGDEGWIVAARATPFVYIAWSLWLVALGVALLL